MYTHVVVMACNVHCQTVERQYPENPERILRNNNIDRSVCVILGTYISRVLPNPIDLLFILCKKRIKKTQVDIKQNFIKYLMELEVTIARATHYLWTYKVVITLITNPAYHRVFDLFRLQRRTVCLLFYF